MFELKASMAEEALDWLQSELQQATEQRPVRSESWIPLEVNCVQHQH